jgi:AcrR family transcriptional regulator
LTDRIEFDSIRPVTSRAGTARAAATQERLLAAAVSELVDSGGHLELRSVAQAAGVVPSVASHHFGSRSGLVAAVVEGFFARFHAEVLDTDLRAYGPWFEREHERVRRGVRFHMTDALAPVVYGSLSRDPRSRRSSSGASRRSSASRRATSPPRSAPASCRGPSRPSSPRRPSSAQRARSR